MSDPFSEIDKEVNIDKIKNFYFKYKYYIFLVSALLIIIPLLIFYFQNKEIKKNLKVSSYYIEILNIVEKDEKKALVELKKLSKLNHKGFKTLSSLVMAKINLKNKEYNLAKENIDNIKLSKIKEESIIKIITYYKAQILLEMNDKKGFDEEINKLLAYEGLWSLLGHELRGHYYIKNKKYDLAKKDFNKIFNEQISSNGLKSRAREMLQKLSLYDEKNT